MIIIKNIKNNKKKKKKKIVNLYFFYKKFLPYILYLIDLSNVQLYGL